MLPKLRYIILSIIIVALGIFVCIYFFENGLEPLELKEDNLTFDLSSYVDYSKYDEKGIYKVNYKSEEELNEKITYLDPFTYDAFIDRINNVYYVNYKFIDPVKIVAQNEKFTMFVDQLSTIIYITVNSTCVAPTEKTIEGFDKYNMQSCDTVYKTASNDNSNLIVHYINSKGEINRKVLSSNESVIERSIIQENKFIDRHYKINFNIENGVEILYQIGDYNNINRYFPQYIDREVMENYFRGNLVFVVDNVEVTSKNYLKYTSAYTWSKECAAYLEEKGLATVTEDFVSGTDPLIDENGNPIPAKWNLTDILEKDSEGRTLNKLKMQIGVDYNPKDVTAPDASPCIANPFMNTYIYGSLFKNYYDLISEKEDDNNVKYNSDWRINVKNSSPTFRLKATGVLEFQKMFEYMYKENKVDDENFLYGNIKDNKKIPTLYDENPYDDIEGVKVPIGGFQARDEQGNFLFDENGKPIQEVINTEFVETQNDLFEEDVETIMPVFQIAMRFELTEEGLKTSLLNNSIIEGKGSDYLENDKKTIYSHDCKISHVDILPNFASSEYNDGKIIVPDGNGSVINFNNNKKFSISKFIYGDEEINKTNELNKEEKLMFGMFGYLDKKNTKGILGIVDQGASQTALNINNSVDNYFHNMTVYFQSYFRSQQKSLDNESNVINYTNEIAPNDFKFIYQLLSIDEFTEDDGTIEYVTLANLYREYLIKKYKIEPKDSTTNNVLSLIFDGRKDYDGSTTFTQAEDIINKLSPTIENINVIYKNWTSDDNKPTTTAVVDYANRLGNIKSFVSFLNEKNINFYPEINVATNYGYKYLKGKSRYSAKDLNNKLSGGEVNFVSPKFYQQIIFNYLDSYERFDIRSGYIKDLGNMKVSDYNINYPIFPVLGEAYQIQALNQIKENFNNLLLAAPFDYAFSTTDFAIEVPTQTTANGYYDYEIPFYQLVISGLFDYSISYDISNNPDSLLNWYILKSLETGSNISFEISNANYSQLADKINFADNTIDSTHIHEGKIIGHKMLNNQVYQVKYSNEVDIIINYSDVQYDYNGQIVSPNSFLVIN